MADRDGLVGKSSKRRSGRIGLEKSFSGKWSEERKRLYYYDTRIRGIPKSPPGGLAPAGLPLPAFPFPANSPGLSFGGDCARYATRGVAGRAARRKSSGELPSPATAF